MRLRSPRIRASRLELELLADVGGLIALALEDTGHKASTAARPSVATKPEATTGALIGDFHHRLPAAFERLEGLPALTESRNALLGLLGKSDPSPDAIVAAIESDIALVIAVLRLANRAAPSKRASIWSVPEAVKVLTPEGVEALARRITVFDFFQRIRGWAVPPEHFRLHAVMTQRAAERLARVVEHPDADRMVVAALLHDVGKLVLMEAYPGYPDNASRERRPPRTASWRSVASSVWITRWPAGCCCDGGSFPSVWQRSSAVITAARTIPMRRWCVWPMRSPTTHKAGPWRPTACSRLGERSGSVPSSYAR